MEMPSRGWKISKHLLLKMAFFPIWHHNFFFLSSPLLFFFSISMSIYICIYFFFWSAMTSAIFRYAIRHIFMADFWLSAMNRHPPLTTLVPCWDLEPLSSTLLDLGDQDDHAKTLEMKKQMVKVSWFMSYANQPACTMVLYNKGINIKFYWGILGMSQLT